MKYFRLKISTGNDVGCVPQTEGAGGTISLNELAKIRSHEKIDFGLNLNYFKLASKAKLTDIISNGLISSTGLTVNDKVKKILEGFNCAAHQYIPAGVCYKDKVHTNYFWFHLTEDNARDIVFSQTQIFSFKPSPWEIPGWNDERTGLTIHSFDEFVVERKKASEKVRSLTTQSLSLKSELSDKDLLTLSGFKQKIIVTEKLKNELERNQVSGMELEPLAFPIYFV